MGELFGDIIIEVFGRIILKTLSEICIGVGSIALDLPLKLMGLNIPWFFCNEKHRFASIFNTILLFLVPIHLYNFGLSNGLFIYWGIFIFIVIALYFMNYNFELRKESSDLLDDDSHIK